MLSLLERSIATIGQRLVLVAPPDVTVPAAFKRVTTDSVRHQRLVGEMQAVRGTVYLQGGYLRPEQLSAGGLHQTPEDNKSWHLLMTDATGRVSSCGWYLNHPNTVSIEDLRVRHCPLARIAEWRGKLHAAVDSEIRRARRAGLYYAELGGWAVPRERRCTSEGLILALAGYGLSRLLGGAIGITAANVTHASSSILRRLGGSYLESDGMTLPAYYDPAYNTMIELLRFDSRRPSAKFCGLIDMARASLTTVSVIASRKRATLLPTARIAAAREWPVNLPGIASPAG
jgi:hypothetical protein